MKILRIIASVDPRTGGPIEGLKLSSLALERMGHSTEVVSLDDPKSPHVLNFQYPVFGAGPVKFKKYAPNLVRWIKNNAHRFDVAIIHGLWNYASIGGWMGLRNTGLPYVVFTHGMLDPWFRKRYPIKHLIKQAFWSVVQGKVLRDASMVLFTSEEEQKLAKGVFLGYKYKGKSISYGVSDPPLFNVTQEKAFRSLVPDLSNKPYILFLSRIHEKKGCDLLLDAFFRISRVRPDLDLVVAGPDRDGLTCELRKKSVELGLGGRVHWPGMLQGDAKWGSFYCAEVFILPSHQENFGIVVAESMACGTPVLITNKVNIWHEVERSGGGYVDDDDFQGILRLVERWIACDELDKKKMSNSARKGYESNFTIEFAARDLLDVLIVCKDEVVK